MREHKYILNGRIPVAEPDVMAWGKWFETANRKVADTYVGKVHISTVFLGIDHGWGVTDAPIVFETMIFGGRKNGYQARYASWEEAEAGHAKAVRIAKRNRLWERIVSWVWDFKQQEEQK